MKISFGVAITPSKDNYFNLEGRGLGVYGVERAIALDVDGIHIILEGEYYYSIIGTQRRRIKSADISDFIFLVVRNHGVNHLPNHLEGSYTCFWYDRCEKKAGLFGDALNRLPVYYTESNGNIEISTNLKDVASRKSGIDQLSLYSYLLLGYPGGRDTFYRGVKKLSSDESFIFGSNGFELLSNPLPVKIESFSEKDLYRYDEIFTNAVASRAGETNVVMNSGGWDSTAILYKLTETQPKGSVSAAVFDVVLPDGQSFNSYEVDKATRIGKFFDIKTETAVIDYSDESLVNYWNSHIENLRNNHTYFWLHHLKIADMIGDNAKTGTRVFNGEASDSIHNFGFSQFVSVNYDNMQLREIADKAKSYLYGPTFFESIFGGNSANDKVLNFFQQYYGKDKFLDTANFDDRSLIESYFQAFMLSYQRVPFAKWQMDAVARGDLQNQYSKHMSEEYFSDIVEQCTSETLYYWLLQLYRRFHFNSFQIGITQVALHPYNLHCAMPFLDSQLLDYMYKMPEDWGRGLELRTTKYPLRFLAEHKWRMPLDILMEKGPHSYIAEGDHRWSYSGGSWNIYCEIMFKSVFAKHFKFILNDARLEEVFESSLFDVEQLRAIVKSYIDGEERPGDVTILFRLAVLFSIGFLD